MQGPLMGAASVAAPFKEKGRIKYNTLELVSAYSLLITYALTGF